MTGGHWGGVALAAVLLFAATNIDDAVVLAALNIAARSIGAPTHRQIWAGQYLGMALVVFVSWLAAFGLGSIPSDWLGLLGFVPLALGIILLLKAIRHRGRPQPPVTVAGLLSVAGATLSGGGDNIAAYTTAFRVMSSPALILTLVVFACCTALWCAGGYALLSH
uniref:cadmium resistance transporter n=1 Tax=Nocardia alni TaxID=2815723 RepID=UPI001C225F35